MDALATFHPAVRSWFERRFALGPTEPQTRGWHEIASGRDTLIAAPTGTGKTLTAFLVCIDRLYREFQGAGVLEDETVYAGVLGCPHLEMDAGGREPGRGFLFTAAALIFFLALPLSFEFTGFRQGTGACFQLGIAELRCLFHWGCRALHT